MGKKLLSWIFTAGVLLLSVTLTVGIAFAGPAQAGANEVLSAAPVLTDKDGSFNTEVLSDTAAWLSDHFFGRQELISAHNYLTGVLFGTSASEDVILGSNGWLYYTPTLEDYTGTAPMSERELFSAANNLALMAEYCQSQGKDFAFMIAPNKNSLYPDNMPDYGTVAEDRDAQRLHGVLDALGVQYIDLYEAFAQQQEVLYFAHDSHWNSKGAALGADLVNAAFGRQSDYFAGDFSQTQEHLGDLYEMLYPAFRDTETDFVYGGTLDFAYQGKSTKPDSITLQTTGSGQGSLLCYRDSFGNLLYPYLADSYESSRFSRSTAYDLTLEAEHVLIELVERNLSYLYTYLPVMPAPQRQLQLPAAAGTVTVESKEVRSPENTRLIQGTLPEDADADSAVYIVCDSGSYEAFCLKDNGFGAYVPADAQLRGIAYRANGALCYLTAQ